MKKLPVVVSRKVVNKRRRDLLSKPSLSQRSVFGEERASRDRAPAGRRKQSVGGGFVSRRSRWLMELTPLQPTAQTRSCRR